MYSAPTARLTAASVWAFSMGATMHAKAPNVLPLFDPPRKMSYRAAVAKAIRDLKATHNLSNVKLADKLDCCEQTLENAEGEANDLNAVTLLRIAYVFGEDAIAPVRDLYLRRHVQPETLAERFDKIERQIASLRKELAE